MVCQAREFCVDCLVAPRPSRAWHFDAADDVGVPEPRSVVERRLCDVCGTGVHRRLGALRSGGPAGFTVIAIDRDDLVAGGPDRVEIRSFVHRAVFGDDLDAVFLGRALELSGQDELIELGDVRALEEIVEIGCGIDDPIAVALHRVGCSEWVVRFPPSFARPLQAWVGETTNGAGTMTQPLIAVLAAAAMTAAPNP